MTHKIGDRASCGECGRILVYTSDGWKHSGINQPRHMAIPAAMPVGAVWVGDAPEEEAESIDATIHTLTGLTRRIVGQLAGAGVHPALRETVEYQIHQLWSKALMTVHVNPEPHQATDDEQE